MPLSGSRSGGGWWPVRVRTRWCPPEDWVPSGGVWVQNAEPAPPRGARSRTNQLGPATARLVVERAHSEQVRALASD